MAGCLSHLALVICQSLAPLSSSAHSSSIYTFSESVVVWGEGSSSGHKSEDRVYIRIRCQVCKSEGWGREKGERVCKSEGWGEYVEDQVCKRKEGEMEMT